MQPPTLEQLSKLETAFSFRFPPAYLAFIERLPAPFLDSLPRARFVVSADEIRDAHREGMPPTLMPFLIESQPRHADYYCFDSSTTAPEYAVVVFAVHVTVAQWTNLADWIKWLEQRPS